MQEPRILLLSHTNDARRAEQHIIRIQYFDHIRHGEQKLLI